jgi:hypothetical protein
MMSHSLHGGSSRECLKTHDCFNIANSYHQKFQNSAVGTRTKVMLPTLSTIPQAEPALSYSRPTCPGSSRNAARHEYALGPGSTTCAPHSRT